MEEDCTSLISMLDIVHTCDCDFTFKTQTVNFPSTKSRPRPSSRPSQILLTVCLFQEIFLAYCLLIKQACIGSHFNAFGSQDYDWSAHKTLFISWPPASRPHLAACRKVRTWCWNILGVVNNHVTSKQVHDLAINVTGLKLSHSFEEYFDHFYISGYFLCTNGGISKHKCKIVCAGCVRDGRHINLVKCHIGVSFTLFCRKSFIVSTCLTFPRLANYYIRYLQINQHLLDLIWQRNVWLCGFCMWRWHESKHHIGDLNCSVVKHLLNRKIGTCWVIWMI